MVVLISVTVGTLIPYLILYRKLSPPPQVGGNSRNSTLHLEVDVDDDDMEDVEEGEGSEGFGRDETAVFSNNAITSNTLMRTLELTKM